MKEVIKFIDLTPEQRKRWTLLDDFSAEFIKALSKTSYYMPGHPSARKAREGLFEKLGKLTSEGNFLTYSRDVDEEKRDVYVTGVFDGTVSLRNVMGGEKGGIYVPKLWEFMHRKRLISVTIKPDISYSEFDEFLNLLAEAPQESFTEDKSRHITKIFVERGIVNVLPVFEEDILEEKKIHWLVRIALSRLRKDLKLLPLFKNISEDRIVQIKKQVFRDIVRPLKRVDLLIELIEHTDLVRKDVKLVSEKEVEKEIIKNIDFRILNSLSREIVKRLDEYKDKEPRLYRNLLTALEFAILRFAERAEPEDQEVLSHIYHAGYVVLERLPPRIREFIKLRTEMMEFLKSRKLARELFVEFKKDKFEEKIKTLKGLFEELLRADKEELALEIIEVLEGLIKSEEIPWKKELAERTLKGIVEDDKLLALLTGLLIKGKEVERVLKILSMAGDEGVEYLFEVLKTAEDRRVRRKVLQLLKERKNRTVGHAISLLKNVSQENQWFFVRNLIFLLNECEESDSAHIIRRFLHHPHFRVREEALSYLLRVKPYDIIDEILPLMDDPSPEIRIRVAYAFLHLRSRRKDVVLKCVEKLLSEEEKDEVKEVIINMFSQMGNLKLPDGRTIEEILISILRARRKKMFVLAEDVASEKLKKTIVKALSEIGGKKSVQVLRNMKDKRLKEDVQIALKRIAQRFSSRG